MDNQTVTKIIEFFGSQAEMARALGVKPQMITKIIKSGKVPARHCKPIEFATGGKITADMIRPDIFAPNRAS